MVEHEKLFRIYHHRIVSFRILLLDRYIRLIVSPKQRIGRRQRNVAEHICIYIYHSSCFSNRPGSVSLCECPRLVEPMTYSKFRWEYYFLHGALHSRGHVPCTCRRGGRSSPKTHAKHVYVVRKYKSDILIGC